jgi:hypothetical protein
MSSSGGQSDCRFIPEVIRPTSASAQMMGAWLGRILTYMAGAAAEIEFFGHSEGGDVQDDRCKLLNASLSLHFAGYFHY